MDTRAVIKFIKDELNIKNQDELSDITTFKIDRIKNLEAGRVKKFTEKEIKKLVQISSLSREDILLSSEINGKLYTQGNLFNKKHNPYYNEKSSTNPLDSIKESPIVSIQKLTCKASAGAGNDITDIDVFDSGEVLHVDKSFFKTPPSNAVRAIQVDGYSMIPMLFPDSWVIFENGGRWSGDGLYVLNWRGELMVKLLQVDPKGMLHIISANKDYKSWEADLEEDQSVFHIIGKVVRSVI